MPSQSIRFASVGLGLAVVANVAAITALALDGIDAFKLVTLAVTMFALGFCLAVWVLLPIIRP